MMPRGRLRACSGFTSADHQRHVVVVAEGRGVVDHHRAGGGELRRVFLRHRAAGGEQRDVDAGRIERRQVLHQHVVAAEHRPCRRRERSLASATSSPTGNSRSARIDSIVSPTAPVAPTTATLYCLAHLVVLGIWMRRVAAPAGKGVWMRVPLRRAAARAGQAGGAAAIVWCRSWPPCPGCAARPRRRRRTARGGAAPGPSAPAPASPRRSGVARMPTQGSWRPVVTTSTALPSTSSLSHRQAQAGGRLERHRHRHLLAGGDAAEDAAGVVGQEARPASSRRGARCPSARRRRNRRRSPRP